MTRPTANSGNTATPIDDSDPKKAPVAPLPFMFEVLSELCRYYHGLRRPHGRVAKPFVASLADFRLAWGWFYDQVDVKKEWWWEEAGTSDDTLLRARAGLAAPTKEQKAALEGVFISNLTDSIDRLLYDARTMTARDIEKHLKAEKDEALARAPLCQRE